VLTTSCICSGQEAVFRCTVDGGVTTVWGGSALENCSDDSVILRHSQFSTGLTINKTCGTTGQVFGQSISVEDGSYTSKLIIENTQQILGSLIICTRDGENNVTLFQIVSSKGILSSSYKHNKNNDACMVSGLNLHLVIERYDYIATKALTLLIIMAVTREPG
jgi:hypothetical protein